MSRLFFLLLKFSFRSERFRPSYLILYSKRAGKPFWVLSRSFFLLSDVSLERFCYRVAFTVPETCSVFLFFYSCFLWQTCFFQHSLILGKLLGRYGHFCFCIDLAECFASDGSNAGCFLHIDSLQFAAACKCIFLNLLHIASDRNFLQLLTALECIFADPCYFVGNAVDLNGFGNVYRSHFLICCNNCCCLLLCVQDLISDLIQNSLVHSRFFRLTWFLCRSLGRFFRWFLRWFFCWFFCWFFGRFFRFRFLQFCFCIL